MAWESWKPRELIDMELEWFHKDHCIYPEWEACRGCSLYGGGAGVDCRHPKHPFFDHKERLHDHKEVDQMWKVPNNDKDNEETISITVTKADLKLIITVLKEFHHSLNRELFSMGSLAKITQEGRDIIMLSAALHTLVEKLKDIK